MSNIDFSRMMALSKTIVLFHTIQKSKLQQNSKFQDENLNFNCSLSIVVKG